MNKKEELFMTYIDAFEMSKSNQPIQPIEQSNRTLQILSELNYVPNYKFDGKKQYEALHEYFLSFFYFLSTVQDTSDLPMVEPEWQSLLLKTYLRYLWLYDGETRVIPAQIRTLSIDVRNDIDELRSREDFYTAVQDRLLHGVKIRKFLLLYAYSFDKSTTIIENPRWEHIINPFGDYVMKFQIEPEKWHNLGNFMIIECYHNILEKPTDSPESIIERKKEAYSKSKSKEANTFLSRYPDFFNKDYFAKTAHKADFDQRRQHIVDYLVKYLCE